MTPTQAETLRQKEFQVNRKPTVWCQSTTKAVKKVVVDHPGAVLLISAGIGVLVGCLIKRR